VKGSPISITFEDIYDLRYTEVDVTYNPTGGEATLGAKGTLLYTPDTDFDGSEVLEYSVCTVETPVRCDKSTITISEVEDDQKKDGATATVVLENAAAVEDEPKSASIIAGAFGAFGVLLAIAGAAIYNKRHSMISANDEFTKNIYSDDTEGTSLTGDRYDNMRPPLSTLKIPYGGNNNNLSVTAFLTGEHVQNPESSKSKKLLPIFTDDKSVTFPISPTNFLFSPTQSVKTSPASSHKSTRSNFVEDTVDL
jgi:hypothetical protein